MIIVDRLLAARQAEGRPVRVGLVGAGFMGRGLLNQIVNTVPGMAVTAVMARRPTQAVGALAYAGVTDTREVGSAGALDRAARAGAVAVTTDLDALVAADEVDVVVDVTGAVELGVHVALGSIAHGKHLVLMNAEVDATIGWELARQADAAGVVYTGCDGDQPGVEMNLYRFVTGLGLTPLLAGNIKGLQDRYRTPTTQRSFAERWGQNTHMVTSFADGTKVNVEQALVANATGMSIHRRGLLGRDHAGHVDELTDAYDVEELRTLGGAVDYVVGARPGPGVFVLAAHDDARQRHYLELYKLGPGPLYSFYAPYHLCHLQVPDSIARAALLGDATIRPLARPSVEVVAVAKRALPAGSVLDQIGGYDYYGECERADVRRSERLLPVGVAEGCTLLRDVPQDQALTYDDVALPPGRRVDQLLETATGPLAGAGVAAV